MSEVVDTKSQIKEALALQDDFSQARPSQEMLEDVPTEVLPDDYREHILFRSDRDHFYIAFSDDSESLEPTEEGYLPNAHLKKISVMNGPKRTGIVIKKWIDKTREAEKEEKDDSV